jgi:hypothetical protein
MQRHLQHVQALDANVPQVPWKDAFGESFGARKSLKKVLFHLFSRLYHDLNQLMINFAKIKVTERP